MEQSLINGLAASDLPDFDDLPFPFIFDKKKDKDKKDGKKKKKCCEKYKKGKRCKNCPLG